MGADLPYTITIRGSSETKVDNDLEHDDLPLNHKLGSRADLRDMRRMGKRQEFSRNFGFLSIVGYSAIAMQTWQGQLQIYIGGLANGGLSNIVYSYLVVVLLWCAVVASMAEMASMAPTSGGQYHWVSEFAPRRYSRILSYVTGWSAVLAWQMSFFNFSTYVSQDIQSLLSLTGSHFQFQPWQASLAIMAMASIAVVFNTNITESLPLMGGAFIILYICNFLAVLVTLWVLGPRTDPGKVFLSFSDRGDTRGIVHSLIFSTFHPLYTLLSPDSAIHMAEEVNDSSLVLPRAIMTGTLLNIILGFLMLITFCFTIGDPQSVISQGITTHIAIFLNATKSNTATVLMTISLDIVVAATCITALTSASRQLFAFARDGGVPFSSVIAHIRPGWNVPFNAMLVSYGFCAILSIIGIFSRQTLGTCVTASVSCNLFTYLVSITCLRLKRWRNEPLPSRRWSLGKWGGLINDISILFLAFLFILFFIPFADHVDVSTMNYTIVAWGGVILLSIVFYYIKGRKMYTSPVSLVQKDNQVYICL